MSYQYKGNPMANVLNQSLTPSQIPGFLSFTGLGSIANASGPVRLVANLQVTASAPTDFFGQTVTFSPGASNGSSATISGAARLVDGSGSTLWTSLFPTSPRLIFDTFTFDTKGNITAWNFQQAGPPELTSSNTAGDGFGYVGTSIFRSTAPGSWFVVPLPAGVWLMLLGVLALFGPRLKSLKA